ncbi:MAG: phytanoyl-CoA dioxygenase, partial [Acidimicrobiales bacterium]
MSSPAPGPSLTDAEVERFVEDGFVRLDDVVAPAVLAAGREVIWSDLAVSPHDRSTWPAPVARLLPSDPAPFRAAFDSPRLAAAFDQLVGTGRWMDRPHLGLFVVRFPHSEVPDDTGWHIDVSFAPDPPAAGSGAPAPDGFDFSRWRVNVASRGRGLLMLFLYCDVGPDDAPTRIRVGSHLDVPAVVAPSGPGGLDQEALGAPVVRASASRPEA